MWKWLSVVLGAIAVLGLAGYWFATGGIPNRNPAAWLTAQLIAHRGRWAEGSARPENSLAAFDEAARNGNAVELDVQLTADGKVVVFHDDDLKRMTGQSGTLSEMSLAELRTVRLLGGEQGIPTLSEALAVIGGRVPVFVEIKNRGSVGALEDEVAREVAAYSGDAAVMSFNPYSLSRVAAAASQIQRGQLSSAFRGEDLPFYQVFLLRNLLMNWTSKPDFIGYDLQALPSLGTRIQRWRGRPLLGWTVEDMDQREAAAEFCDGLICNPGALPASN